MGRTIPYVPLQDIAIQVRTKKINVENYQNSDVIEQANGVIYCCELCYNGYKVMPMIFKLMVACIVIQY